MTEPQIPYDAGDEAQVKGRKKASELIRKREMDDLREVLSTPAGRRYLWRMLGVAGVHRSSFNTNALTMANNEGRRSVGLQIEFEILEAAQDKFLEMQAENSKKENANG